MCLKKSLMEVIYFNNLEVEYYKVMNIFKSLKKENLEYVSIDYFFILEKFNKDTIYNLFHILLEYKIIEKYEFIECSSCGAESKYDKRKINICSRCKEVMYSDFILENFKLLEDTLYENE